MTVPGRRHQAWAPSCKRLLAPRAEGFAYRTPHNGQALSASTVCHGLTTKLEHDDVSGPVEAAIRAHVSPGSRPGQLSEELPEAADGRLCRGSPRARSRR